MNQGKTKRKMTVGATKITKVMNEGKLVRSVSPNKESLVNEGADPYQSLGAKQKVQNFNRFNDLLYRSSIVNSHRGSKIVWNGIAKSEHQTNQSSEGMKGNANS
jgi:hypothetical protein